MFFSGAFYCRPVVAFNHCQSVIRVKFCAFLAEYFCGLVMKLEVDQFTNFCSIEVAHVNLSLCISLYKFVACISWLFDLRITTVEEQCLPGVEDGFLIVSSLISVWILANMMEFTKMSSDIDG